MATSDLIARRKPLTANIGLFGVGLDIYWQQFPDLLDALIGYMDVFEKMVQTNHVQTVNFGMIDNAEVAYAKLKEMKAADLDLVFCDMLTYATSSTFGIIIREFRCAYCAGCPAAAGKDGLCPRDD